MKIARSIRSLSRLGLGNRFYMAVSIFTRMGVGLGVFVILARSLGPVDFGFVSAVLAYAGFASIVTDFGFPIRTLRDIAANPSEAASILSSALSAKAALMATIATIGLVALLFLPLQPWMRLTASLLATGFMIGSLGDLALVSFRALGNYRGETLIVTATSSFYIAVMVPIALFHLGPVAVGAGYFGSRFVHFTVSLVTTGRQFPDTRLQLTPPRVVLRTLGNTTSWAMDSALLYLNSQIDGLVVAPLVGLGAAGIYLSGSRLVQASLGFVSVISNIHIPKLSAQQNPKKITIHEIQMMAEFIGMGIALALVFLFGGPFISKYLLGSKYLGVNILWPGFAAFLMFRMAASSFGASLSVLGKPLLRVTGQLPALIVVTVGFWLLLPRYGIVAAPWIMAAGSAIQCLIFGIWRHSLLQYGKDVTNPKKLDNDE